MNFPVQQAVQQNMPQKKYPYNIQPYAHHQHGNDLGFQNYYNKRHDNYVSADNIVPNNRPNVVNIGQDYNTQNNNLPEKDKDVWDPPPPKPQSRRNPNPKPRVINNNDNGKKKISIESNKVKERNYEKPWQKNAVNPEKEKEKQAQKDKEREQNAFLYSVYPDGDGPDADLIKMLQRDMLETNLNVQFDDIAGLGNAKETVQRAALLPILKPEVFTGLVKPWKGVLMYGPPGTGKTMLARAVATTGQTRFFGVSAGTFSSKWRGDSEKLVRYLFQMARFYSPTILFFDEIDSVMSSRDSGNEHESSRKLKTEVLIQMDGIGSEMNNDGKKPLVLVLAATNRPWDLDNAMLRRLEKRVYIPLPTPEGRRELFELNLKKMKCIREQIDMDYLVEKTKNYSGADIQNVCCDAAFEPIKKGGKFNDLLKMESDEIVNTLITMQDFDVALKNRKSTVGNKHLDQFETWTNEFSSQ